MKEKLKYNLFLLELYSMRDMASMLVEKDYLYNKDIRLKENFMIEYKWLTELIKLFEEKKIIIKK